MIFVIVLILDYSIEIALERKERLKAKKAEEIEVQRLVLEAKKELEFMESLEVYTPQVNKLLEETNYIPNTVVIDKEEKESSSWKGVAVLMVAFGALWLSSYFLKNNKL